MVVLELLSWFKKDFFSWVNSLPCSRCGGATKDSGSLSPTTDDLRWGAQRVENHYCQSCQLSTRFPRCASVCVCAHKYSSVKDSWVSCCWYIKKLGKLKLFYSNSPSTLTDNDSWITKMLLVLLILGSTIQRSCSKPEGGAVESGPIVSHCAAEPWALRRDMCGTAQVCTSLTDLALCWFYYLLILFWHIRRNK